MSGAILLGVISLVAITDLILALWFKSQADRAESDVGTAPATGTPDPANYRRMARFLFLSAPLMWLVVAALAFGAIPVAGIIPISF